MRAEVNAEIPGDPAAAGNLLGIKATVMQLTAYDISGVVEDRRIFCICAETTSFNGAGLILLI